MCLAQALQNVLQAWKAFYAARWQPSEPQLSSPGEKPLPWQAHYGRKMRVQRVFAGRARQDSFFGHKGGIKCLGLLPGHCISPLAIRLRSFSVALSIQVHLLSEQGLQTLQATRVGLSGA